MTKECSTVRELEVGVRMFNPEILRHLEGCDSCSRELRLARALRSFAGAEPAPPLSSHLWRARLREQVELQEKITRPITAMVVLSVIVGLTIILLLFDSNQAPGLAGFSIREIFSLAEGGIWLLLSGSLALVLGLLGILRME